MDFAEIPNGCPLMSKPAKNSDKKSRHVSKKVNKYLKKQPLYFKKSFNSGSEQLEQLEPPLSNTPSQSTTYQVPIQQSHNPYTELTTRQLHAQKSTSETLWKDESEELWFNPLPNSLSILPPTKADGSEKQTPINEFYRPPTPPGSKNPPERRLPLSEAMPDGYKEYSKLKIFEPKERFPKNVVNRLLRKRETDFQPTSDKEIKIIEYIFQPEPPTEEEVLEEQRKLNFEKREEEIRQLWMKQFQEIIREDGENLIRRGQELRELGRFRYLLAQVDREKAALENLEKRKEARARRREARRAPILAVNGKIPDDIDANTEDEDELKVPEYQLMDDWMKKELEEMRPRVLSVIQRDERDWALFSARMKKSEQEYLAEVAEKKRLKTEQKQKLLEEEQKEKQDHQIAIQAEKERVHRENAERQRLFKIQQDAELERRKHQHALDKDTAERERLERFYAAEAEYSESERRKKEAIMQKEIDEQGRFERKREAEKDRYEQQQMEEYRKNEEREIREARKQEIKDRTKLGNDGFKAQTRIMGLLQNHETDLASEERRRAQNEIIAKWSGPLSSEALATMKKKQAELSQVHRKKRHDIEKMRNHWEDFHQTPSRPTLPLKSDVDKFIDSSHKEKKVGKKEIKTYQPPKFPKFPNYPPLTRASENQINRPLFKLLEAEAPLQIEKPITQNSKTASGPEQTDCQVNGTESSLLL